MCKSNKIPSIQNIYSYELNHWIKRNLIKVDILKFTTIKVSFNIREIKTKATAQIRFSFHVVINSKYWICTQSLCKKHSLSVEIIFGMSRFHTIFQCDSIESVAIMYIVWNTKSNHRDNASAVSEQIREMLISVSIY